jgi:hypothetical protein
MLLSRKVKLVDSAAAPSAGKEARHVTYASLPSRYSAGGRYAARQLFSARGN